MRIHYPKFKKKFKITKYFFKILPECFEFLTINSICGEHFPHCFSFARFWKIYPHLRRKIRNILKSFDIYRMWNQMDKSGNYTGCGLVIYLNFPFFFKNLRYARKKSNKTYKWDNKNQNQNFIIFFFCKRNV